MTNQNDLMREAFERAEIEGYTDLTRNQEMPDCYMYASVQSRWNTWQRCWPEAQQAATQSALEAAAKVCEEKAENAKRAAQNARGDFGLAVSAQYAALHDCLQAIRALAGKGE